MSERLFEVFGITFTVAAVYGIMSVVVLLLFMIWWLMNRKKRTGKPIFAGQVMNGIGFGLLPHGNKDSMTQVEKQKSFDDIPSSF